MKLYNRFERPETIPAQKCPKDEQRYIEKIDKNGHSYLVDGELVPFYENIQKYKDDCDIYKILNRYENGDPEVIKRLDTQRGQFGDFTDLPTNIIDIKNKLNSAEKLFESLPLEDRQVCDNNVNVFLSNLTKGVLPNSLQKLFAPAEVEPVVSTKVEEKIENASASSPATIHEAINGQGGNV